MTITVCNTDMRCAGKRGISKKYSRRDLERTAMDFLTFDMDFNDALDIVESATDEELIELIYKNQNQ